MRYVEKRIERKYPPSDSKVISEQRVKLEFRSLALRLSLAVNVTLGAGVVLWLLGLR